MAKWQDDICEIALKGPRFQHPSDCPAFGDQTIRQPRKGVYTITEGKKRCMCGAKAANKVLDDIAGKLNSPKGLEL